MRVLLLGPHSARNLGDDAIMYQTLSYLDVALGKPEVTIVANDPASWQHHVRDGVKVVGSLTHLVVDRSAEGDWNWRKVEMVRTLVSIAWAWSYRQVFRRGWGLGTGPLSELLAAYAEADLVLVCGGGNLYAHNALSAAFLWLLFSIALALWLHRPVVLLPQSIGPVKGALQRLLLRAVLSRAALIMLREGRSAELLRELDVPGKHLVVPDLAFGLPPLTSEPAHPNEIWIGLTVMDRGQQLSGFGAQRAYEEAVELAARSVIDDSSSLVRLFIFVQCFGPSQDQDDRRIAQRLYARLIQSVDHVALVDTIRDPLFLRRRYADLNCMIGTRMHTAIFAAGSGVPTVLIGYQPKAWGTMEYLGLGSYVCNIASLESGQLAGLVRSVLDNHDQLSRRIYDRYCSLSDDVSSKVVDALKEIACSDEHA